MRPQRQNSINQLIFWHPSQVTYIFLKRVKILTKYCQNVVFLGHHWKCFWKIVEDHKFYLQIS